MWHSWIISAVSDSLKPPLKHWWSKWIRRGYNWGYWGYWANQTILLINNKNSVLKLLNIIFVSNVWLMNLLPVHQRHLWLSESLPPALRNSIISKMSAQKKYQFQSKENQNIIQRKSGWCSQGEKRSMTTRNSEALQLGAVELAMRPLYTFLQLRIVSWATVTPARPLMWQRAVWYPVAGLTALPGSSGASVYNSQGRKNHHRVLTQPSSPPGLVFNQSVPELLTLAHLPVLFKSSSSSSLMCVTQDESKYRAALMGQLDQGKQL